jgi:hypothetical protein
MKKKLFVTWLFGLALASVLVLTGCVTSGIYYTDSDFADGQCTIENIWFVDAFDGKPVNWITDGGVTVAVIPAGVHEISIRTSEQYNTGWDYDFIHGTRTQYYQPYTTHAVIKYPFEAGKKYKLSYSLPQLRYEGTMKEGRLISGAQNVRVTKEGGRFHVYHVNISVTEVKKGAYGFIGKTFAGLDYTWTTGMGWTYPDSLGYLFGPRLGFGIIHGNFDMKLVGKAGVGIGLGFNPDNASFAFTMPAYAGGLLEFYFPKFGIGIGGGTTAAWTLGERFGASLGGTSNRFMDGLFDHGSPYFELVIIPWEVKFGSGSGLSFQYYPGANAWHSKIGLQWEGRW